MAGAKVDYRILGPLEAHDGERALMLGGAKQRAVLALLLLRGNEALTRDVIIDQLWGESPPPTAAKVLQNCVSALRKELPGGAERLRTFGTSYALELGPDELDRDRFEHSVTKARAAAAAGDHGHAADALRQALGMWRGAPLSDFAYERFAEDEIVRLQELYVAAVEDRIDADFACGRAEELVPELEGLVSRHPLRERLRGQLMLALYRAGRQADALAAYQDARAALLGELGLEPTRALQELQKAILAQDPQLDARRVHTITPGRHAATPVLGRDAELAVLEAGVDDALAGRGRLFLLVGPAGAGKTKLADELASRAKARGVTVRWGRGWDGGDAPPYWPWRQAIRELPENDGAGRFEYFTRVTEVLRETAREQPVLLVLDDLQAADEDSLVLLEFVASEVAEMPVLILALARDEVPRLERFATRTIQLGS
jgi:DNA-binding SARP family transcriptional activator